MHCSSTHVHVGIEDRAKVLPILRAVLTRSAQIQAVTASSPFWDRKNTGYADNRAMIFQQLRRVCRTNSPGGDQLSRSITTG